jgi:thymidine kinase
MDEFRTGHLEVVCGPMFSGKTEELIRRMKRVQISGKKFLLFKPIIDTRYSKEHVISHDMRKLDAIVTGIDRKSLEDVEIMIFETKPDVVGFDEANFYDDYIIELIKKCVKAGIRVVASGLDTTFRGEPFGPMGYLLAIADHVDKLQAICMKCKNEPAVMTQRIINGKPARYDDPTILVGAAESYEARCRKCHELVY